MSSRDARARCSRSSALAVVVAVLPAFMLGLPRAAVRLRRHLPHRADRAQHPHRLHGPDLARPRRVHGDRRLHDGDPDGRSRRQGHLDDPDRGRSSPGVVGFLFGHPGAPALGALPRARDVRDRRRDARGDQEVRGLHRRRHGHQPVRHAGADRVARRRSTILGLELNFNNWLYYLALDDRARAATSSPGCSSAGGPAARSGRSATARPPRRRPASACPATRRSPSAISAAYAGVAGSLFAIATTFVNPDTFPITLSIFLLVGVVVGGLGSLTGLIVGAIFIQFLPLWAQEVSKSPGAPGRRLRRRPDRAHARAPRGRRRACSRACSGCRAADDSEALTRRGYHRATIGDPASFKETSPMNRKLALDLRRARRDARPRCDGRARPARPRSRDPGVTADIDPARRHRAALRAASAYASVARGAEAYFKYVNAKGGVNGRKIDVQVRRRRLQPGADASRRRASSSSRTRSSRSSTRSAPSRTSPIRAYLNAHEGAAALRRVRRDDVRAQTTRSTRTRSASSRATRPRAGSTASTSRARSPRAKVAVLFQNDDYGKDLLAGLKRGLAALEGEGRRRPAVRGDRARRRSRRSRSSSRPGGHAARSSRRRRSRSRPTSFANKLGWKPQARRSTTPSRRRRTSCSSPPRAGRTRSSTGSISIAFLKDPTDPKWTNDPAMKLYRHDHEAVRAGRERERRLPRLRDGCGLDGGRGAEAAGKNLTRDGARQGRLDT